MADSGFPIVGDPYYNPWFIQYLHHTGEANQPKPILGVTKPHQMMLQAFRLEFPNPYSPKRIELELPVWIVL